MPIAKIGDNQNLTCDNFIKRHLNYRPDDACAVFFSIDTTSGGPSPAQLTFRDAHHALHQHQQWLRDKIYLLHGRQEVVVAYLSHNSIDFFLSVMACTRQDVGALPALLNTRWTASEMLGALQLDASSQERHQHENWGACSTLLLYGPGWEQAASALAKAHDSAGLPQSILVCFPIPDFALQLTRTAKSKIQQSDPNNSSPAFSQKLEPHQRQLRHDDHPNKYSPDDAVIVFTSGTTSGRSKGVRISHRALAWQCAAKGEDHFSSNTKVLANTVPFFHIGGLANLFAVWKSGGCLVLPSNSLAHKSFSPDLVYNTLRHTAVNTLIVVPAMLFALQQKDVSNQHFPQVQLLVVGGQSLSEPQLTFCRRTFSNARIVQTYACTEATSSMTYHTVPRHLLQNDDTNGGDCVGSPPSHVQVVLLRDGKIDTRDDSDSLVTSNNLICQPYTRGVIATRGPHVMNGYWSRYNWHDSQDLKKKDEWLVTNDVGYWSSDRTTNRLLYWVGRVDDTIRTGGETVVAVQVERILLRHPRITECSVFGIPHDARFGNVVAAACVLTGKSNDLTLQELRSWCHQEGLAGYKHPRRLFCVSALPRNASGKVLKYELVKRYGTGPSRL